MNPQQIIESELKKFDELLRKTDNESDFEKGISYEDRSDIYEPLKDFLLASLSRYNEEVVKMVEEMPYYLKTLGTLGEKKVIIKDDFITKLKEL